MLCTDPKKSDSLAFGNFIHLISIKRLRIEIMCPLGVHTFFSAFMPEQAAAKAALILPCIALLLWLSSILTSKQEPEGKPVSLPGWSLLSIWPFFERRFDFLHRGFQITGQSIYQFKLLHNTVVVLSGESARRDFFQSKQLDLNAGFKFLSGAIPMMPGVTSNLQARQVALIHKRLVAAQSSERLSRLIPEILDDSRRLLDCWGISGTLDPFNELSQLIFQTTVRSIGCADLADDAEVVAQLKNLYDTLDTATTPASVLFSWFPSPSAVKRLLATKKIYDIINRAVTERLQGGVPRDDTLQLLLDHEDDKMLIVGFIMGLLVAGSRSTGTTGSWMITFLSGHPHWQATAAGEVKRLLERYSSHPTYSPACDPSSQPHSLASLSAQLSDIPLEAWENEVPVLDSIIRETLRLAEPHAAMRQNVGPEIRLGGKIVPGGAYVVYPYSDVHLNPELYPDPLRFDPARGVSKMPYAYVGLGGGNTMCLGQRLAKLELKLITALLVLGFELHAVDQAGLVLDELPQPDWNDTLTWTLHFVFVVRLYQLLSLYFT
ncbi:Lanosterol 14-alpha demethylase [Grifola frondosa]|uniref:Lanosterol 14-alpha demethylase n=1 Tax=Grifola frondosa TaxID=5627 RepID=A0A1C7LTY3_GRIFR|nr:Lanosterol 14-alpha demethylase [Grifola frondosa]